MYDKLADLVLLLHFAIVLFNIGGLVVIFIGNALGWSWVNVLWFRIVHLATIAIIVLQAWLGRLCPLTVLERELRTRAGQIAYEVGFIEHWVETLLYHDAPLWVFTLAYTLFGLLVGWAWWRFPPAKESPTP